MELNAGSAFVTEQDPSMAGMVQCGFRCFCFLVIAFAAVVYRSSMRSSISNSGKIWHGNFRSAESFNVKAPITEVTILEEKVILCSSLKALECIKKHVLRKNSKDTS